MAPSADTIFALSSGRPPAAIAVIRISGPQAGHALQVLTSRIPEPRKAALVRIRDGEDIIDEALALWFPGPNSETGEDIAELQLHGGRAVIAAALGALGKISGLRPAEPGEFTRRAFENGKLDLTAVEALADLVIAETQAQRRQAFRQLKGALGDRAESWRQRLIGALALVEARIDFSDEGDVQESDSLLLPGALAIARELAREIGAALDDNRYGERLRDGLVVAILGPPNAGKSTLLNRIARREAAIVSPYAGTTRDVIEVHLDLGGYPVTLLDTAGIRESADPVEAEGVRRARARAAEADLVLWVVDAGERGAASPEMPSSGPPVWLVANKSDLVQGRNEQGFMDNESLSGNEQQFSNSESKFNSGETGGSVSAVSGAGVDQLMDRITRFAAQALDSAEPTLITRERHRRTLSEALAALQRATAAPAASREDLTAEELRMAARALGRLTGRVDVEDVLDVIFRDFCVGK